MEEKNRKLAIVCEMLWELVANNKELDEANHAWSILDSHLSELEIDTTDYKDKARELLKQM